MQTPELEWLQTVDGGVAGLYHIVYRRHPGDSPYKRLCNDDQWKLSMVRLSNQADLSKNDDPNFQNI